jgi:tetratricopeptide (TPR) repeat protein
LGLLAAIAATGWALNGADLAPTPQNGLIAFNVVWCTLVLIAAAIGLWRAHRAKRDMPSAATTQRYKRWTFGFWSTAWLGQVSFLAWGLVLVPYWQLTMASGFSNRDTYTAISFYEDALSSPFLPESTRLDWLPYAADLYARAGGREVGEKDDYYLALAYERYHDLHTLQPDNPAAIRGMIMMLIELGAYDAALTMAQALETSGLEHARDGLIYQSQIHHIKGDADTAIALLKRFPVAEDEDDLGLPYHYHYGQALMKSKRYADAITHFSDGVQQSREVGTGFMNPWAVIYRACATAALGDMEEAVADAEYAKVLFEKSIKEDGLRDQWDFQREELKAVIKELKGREGKATDADNVCDTLITDPFALRERSEYAEDLNTTLITANPSAADNP